MGVKRMAGGRHRARTWMASSGREMEEERRKEGMEETGEG